MPPSTARLIAECFGEWFGGCFGGWLDYRSKPAGRLMEHGRAMAGTIHLELALL
jgi:hypothetical protein